VSDDIPWKQRTEFPGTITVSRSAVVFDVLLDDGRLVTASVSLHVARDMFRIAVGDRVRLKFRPPPRTARIVGFHHDA
jgi:translation initiation factor IF-1